MWPFPSSTRPHPEDKQIGQTSISAIQDAAPLSHEATTDSFRIWDATGHPGERLGIPAIYRVPLITGTSMLCGFSLGAAKGGAIAADRYRAENAHRFPTTKSGWYLYHKTKSYHYTIGSVKEGVKFGLRLAGWTSLFALTEEIIDRGRERVFSGREDNDERVNKQRDAASTTMAAMTTSGAYSWTQGFDRFAAGRIAKLSLKYSLAYGLVQDALATARGQQPEYVRWIATRIFGTTEFSAT